MYWNERASSGYEGYSRSLRSREAIKNDEVPLSMFKRDFINRVIDVYDCSEQDKKFLKKIAIAKLKFVASELCGANSWHHTSMYFNKTDHYSVDQTLAYCLDNRDSFEEAYKKHKNKAKSQAYKYGVIEYPTFEGSRRRPRFAGNVVEAGIVIDKWLYFTSGAAPQFKTISKKNITGSNIKWVKQFDSIAELRAANPDISKEDEYFEFIKHQKKLA